MFDVVIESACCRYLPSIGKSNGAEEETRSISNIIDLIVYFCHLLALGTWMGIFHPCTSIIHYRKHL